MRLAMSYKREENCCNKKFYDTGRQATNKKNLSLMDLVHLPTIQGNMRYNYSGQ